MNKCKPILIALLACCFTLNASAQQVNDNTNLTLVVPSKEQSVQEVQVNEVEEKEKVILYPVDVEMSDNGYQRYITKSYEIKGNQSPDDIPREPFEQDGYYYSLTDIIKNTEADTLTKTGTKTVTVETKTKDMEEILDVLPETQKFKNKNGYAGTLFLDIKSIVVESKGVGYSSYTMKKTREYPYLSSNDTSLVPKTITENGVTLTLDDIDWGNADSSTIDYYSEGDTFTAIATYSGTASSSYNKGYTVTAKYKGDVHKAATAKTLYIAHFIGNKIEPTLLPFVNDIENTGASQEIAENANIVETVEIEANGELNVTSENELSLEPKADNEIEAKQENKYSNLIFAIVFIFLLIAVAYILFMYYKKTLELKTVKAKLNDQLEEYLEISPSSSPVVENTDNEDEDEYENDNGFYDTSDSYTSNEDILNSVLAESKKEER